MRSARRAAHLGFSLLELVLVLSVIAGVAAVAWSRLVDLQVSARQARLQSAAGAVRAAAALFKAQCLALQAVAQGPGSPRAASQNNVCAELTLDGVGVTGVHAYPTADVRGIARAAQLDATDPRLSTYQLSGGGQQPGDQLWISLPGPTDGRCRFAYRAPMHSGTAPVIVWTTEQTRCD